MYHAAQILAFLIAVFGLAIAMWPLLGVRSFTLWPTFIVCVALLFTPYVIDSQNITIRALGCVLAVELFFKTTDYAAQRRISLVEDRRFITYAKFLVPFPVLLVRFGQRKRSSRFNWSKWGATAVAMIAFVFSFVLIDLVSSVAVIRSSFLLDHTIMFFIFAFAIEALARSLHGFEQIASYDTKPLIDQAFRSRTVGEFWCRYNTRVHSWFDHNVFRRLDGKRRPVRAVFLTFFVSAVLHEIGFAIATSRIDGYQLTFFMLQAPAVILCRYFRRVVRGSPFGKIVLHGLTILWMWATSILFFHGVNRVFPFFYASEPWLL